MGSAVDGRMTPTTLAERIAVKLRADIMSSRFAPGQRLPTEQELAESFGASTPTVRGALRQLVAQGLVFSKRGPNGGYFVDRPSVEATGDIAGAALDWLVLSGLISGPDVLEAHQTVSVACSRLAAQRRSDMDLFRIEQAVIKLSDSSLSNQMFTASVVQLSRRIAAASGNPLFKLLTLLTSRAHSTALRDKVFKFEERQAIGEICRSVAAAIRARQIDNAGEKLGAYFEFIGNVSTTDDIPPTYLRKSVAETEIAER